MTSSRPPAATVVIAAYNRPGPLRAAVRSVLRQTRGDWRLLVVGDGCDQATASVALSFDDPRVRFFNLPDRFGEQAGPNSVGMALARTPFTAFLNQDDLWLPDHLETALAALEREEADIFLGRAAVARASVDGRPVFSGITAARRAPATLFHRNATAAEPASGWVFRSALARRVGPWRSHREILRLPVQDWLLRAWRAGARFAFGAEVTLLYLSTHYQRAGAQGAYREDSPEHEFADRLLAESPPSAVRALLAKERDPRQPEEGVTRVFGSRSPWGKLVVKVAANPLTAALYRATGWDCCSALLPLAGARKGWGMARLHRLRTGADAPPVCDYLRQLDSSIDRVRRESGEGGQGGL